MFGPCRDFSGCLRERAAAAKAGRARPRPRSGARLLALLIILSSAVQAPAKDVAREQSAVEYARQEFERAEAEHKADLEQAERTRTALESLKKQLAQEQDKARLSAKSRQQAKTKLDEARRALERAWKQ